MKATPKTDEVIDILKQTVTVINLIEYNLREIERTDSKADEAKGVINAYKGNLDYCHSCKVTAKDVYDEYWAICPSMESLPKYAKALAVRFENVGIPVWVCDPHSSYQKQINEKIWDMEKQGIITKKQASDLMCLFDLLAKWVMVWVFRVQNILKEMGVEPLPIQADKPEGTDDEAKNKPTLPEVLNTDEAKKWLQVAIDGGLLNSDYSPTDKTGTKPQKALLAEILSDKIGLKYKYKPFETLWNVSGLSKQRYKSREETGTVEGSDIITEVFSGK